MLSVSHLKKTYTTRGGAVTNALDDVSLTFGERGMVFLLGRSGSGKSTLLNIAGGLDVPDSGEVIVKGRSSLEFSRDDFDSYRNTFVGFVFQEYNILNEFSVAENIGLALELQGKPADKAAVDAILRRVDLEGLGKRKPNTLSGGQKQRVAIARALVKDPEILMADEPTGALDSNTGRQVLETLKALSEDKLVIVVSHDREFAEQYGDRIIELADGRVISDVSKSSLPPEHRSERLTFLGEHTVSVRAGTRLSPEEMETLSDFISAGDSPVLISRDSRDIETFRRAARIGEDGSRETFADTPEQQEKAYTREESRFIRSRLPLRKAARIGASSLRVKPIRLIMTVLLSSAALVMFGLLATMMGYSEDRAMDSAFGNARPRYYMAEKTARIVCLRGDDSYDMEEAAWLNASDLQKLEQATGQKTISVRRTGGIVASLNANLGENTAPFYRFSNFVGFASMTSAEMTRMGFRLTAGRLPAAADEVCLPAALYETFRACSYRQGNEASVIRREADLLGRKLDLGVWTPTVVGIFTDGSEPDPRYAELEDVRDEYDLLARELTGLASMFRTEFFESMDSVLLVAPAFFTEQKDSLDQEEPVHTDIGPAYAETREGEYRLGSWTRWCPMLANPSMLAGKELLMPERNARLEPGQVMFSLSDLYDCYDQLLWDGSGRYVPTEEMRILHDTTDIYGEDTEAKRLLAEKMAEALDAHSTDVWGTDWRKFTISTDDAVRTYTVVGVVDVAGWNVLGFCDEDYNDLYELLGGFITTYETHYVAGGGRAEYALIPADGADRGALLGLHREGFGPTDCKYVFANTIVNDVEDITDMIDEMSVVFLWVGCALAAFAALLLFNFISVSISYKRREIGILRAVGARGADVFRIFFSESGIICLVCFALSCAGSFAFARVLSRAVTDGFAIGFDLFIFSLPQAAAILVIAAAVAVAGTWLPVFLAARRSPVSSIRSL